MKSSEIKELLPVVLQQGCMDGSPMQALLEVMAAYYESIEQMLDAIDLKFNPHKTVDRLVPVLAYWVDMLWLLGKSSLQHHDDAVQCSLTEGLGQLRELIANASELSQWRGTARSIVYFLKIATGIEEISIKEQVKDEKGHIIPFFVQITFPPKVKDNTSLCELIDLILQKEMPVYVTYEVLFTKVSMKEIRRTRTMSIFRSE